MTKKQLFDIAMDESRDLSERYEAARILQSLNLHQVSPAEVNRLYQEFVPGEIAEMLHVSHQVINGVVAKYRLWEAVSNEMSVSGL